MFTRSELIRNWDRQLIEMIEGEGVLFKEETSILIAGRFSFMTNTGVVDYRINEVKERNIVFQYKVSGDADADLIQQRIEQAMKEHPTFRLGIITGNIDIQFHYVNF